MSAIGNDRVNNYINEVCGLVKNKRVHENIKEELLNHIDEIVEDQVSRGKPEEEAIEQAILQMGASDVVGKGLNKVHKAAPDWTLLLMTIGFILFGIFTLGIMERNNLMADGYQVNYMLKTAIFAGIGSIITVIILKVDYRNLKKYSKYIYLGTIAGMIFAIFFSSRIHGAIGWITIGPISFNAFHIAIFTLVLSLSGIFEEWDWSNKKSIIQGALLAFGPCILFIQSYSMAHIAIYIIAVITLVIISGVKLRYILYPAGLLGILSVVYFFKEPYRLERVTSFIKPMEDPEGAGWIYNQLNNIRNSATLFGKDPSLVISKLPEANTDFILTYIIYSFGWIVGFILISMVLTFIIRIGTIGLKTKDRYGRLIVTGLSALFTTQFLMNILMNFTLMPTLSINMPFISYGGSSLIINMVSIAIILNVFKWRNTPYIITER